MEERNSAQNQWLDELVESLERNGVCTRSNLAACDDNEVAKVESQYPQGLPESYKGFLKLMGRGAGKFFVGTDIFYPDILGLNEDAVELVKEDRAGLSLPANAIVFAMHQGYQFMFLDFENENEPSVFNYMEQGGKFELQSESLSQYLLASANDSW